MEQKLLLLGDEAIAQGALDAGISGGYAYPGTPSTEILEYIQAAPEAEARGVHRKWSSNEKTAMEAALGMSYAGRRVLVSMKHVGLNVAADGFVNSAITGTNGGLVVVVADDPSMHSSQNEQDSRAYGRFAMVPVFEPSSQQEAYDMMFEAFALSEEMKVPVLMRITTRLAHSRADVTRREPLEPKQFPLPTDPKQFTLLPVNARRNYIQLIDKQNVFITKSEESIFNQFVDGADKSLGILAMGITANYLRECYPESSCPHPVLYVRQYPLPEKALQQLKDSTDSLLILEEGMPVAEEMLRGIGVDCAGIKGRLDGTLPRTGELTPEHVAEALGVENVPTMSPPSLVRPRPPQLCQGCPHRDSYEFLNEALKEYENGRVFSDIGCYTLGALSPFEAIHTCVDMGASITMAKGGADAGVHPAIAVIGDSTFTHSGMTGLLDCVYENTPVVIIILDNDTTGMTGMQDSLATGRLHSICAGLGVAPEHIRDAVPLRKNHDANVAMLHEEIAHQGVSVVIAKRSCIHLKRRQ